MSRLMRLFLRRQLGLVCLFLATLALCLATWDMLDYKTANWIAVVLIPVALIIDPSPHQFVAAAFDEVRGG